MTSLLLLALSVFPAANRVDDASVQKRDPAGSVDEIVQKYVRVNSCEALRAKAFKREYDHLRKEEKRGFARIESPLFGKWREECEGVPISADMTSKKLDAQGTPYSLKSAQTSNSDATPNLVQSLFGGDSPGVLESFLLMNKQTLSEWESEFEIRTVSHRSTSLIAVRFRPKTFAAASQFSEATLLIDRLTFRPKHVQIWAPARTSESVYSLSEFIPLNRSHFGMNQPQPQTAPTKPCVLTPVPCERQPLQFRGCRMK